MKNVVLLLTVLLCAGCVSRSVPNDKTSEFPSPHISSQQSERADIKVLLDPDTNEAGILVQVTSPVPASGDKMGEVRITIFNYLDEEVFIGVTGFDKLTHSFSRSDADGNTVAWSYGGGRDIVSPDNTRLLKRLEASSLDIDGERCPSRFGTVHIEGRLDMERLDLKQWVGADTKVSVPIEGYLRKSGKRFLDIVSVPIAIIDSQEQPAGDVMEVTPEE